MSLRHAILGFLELDPTSGYTLQQRFDGSVGSFWSATQSQIYRELHGLRRAGLAQVEIVPQDGKPARKVYRITPAGSLALRRWLAEPLEPMQLRDPMLLKLVFASDVDAITMDGVLAGYAAQLEVRRAEYAMRRSRPAIFSLARSPRERLLWQLLLENGLAWCDAMLVWTANARRRLLADGKRATRNALPPGAAKGARAPSAKKAAPGATHAPAKKAAPGATHPPTKKATPGATHAPAKKAAPGATHAPPKKAAPGATHAPAKKAARGATHPPTKKAAQDTTRGAGVALAAPAATQPAAATATSPAAGAAETRRRRPAARTAVMAVTLARRRARARRANARGITRAASPART